MMISETKIDGNFLQEMLLINRFAYLCRLNRDSKGGRIMIYLTGDIPSNFLMSDNKAIETFFVELNLQNIKMLINCFY